MTVPECKDSIIKEGFIASCRPNVEWVQYPPRNYFFTKLDINLMDSYVRKAQKISNKNGNVVLFHIDTTKLKDVKFYSNPMFAKKQAIYTYDNIPAKAICNIIEADWNDE